MGSGVKENAAAARVALTTLATTTSKEARVKPEEGARRTIDQLLTAAGDDR